LAGVLGARAAGEIFFTASATESNNLALLGVMRGARAAREEGRAHLITTQIEHDSTLQVARALEKEGVAVTYLAPDRGGMIAPETLEGAIRPGETVLASIIHGHYQFGTIQDLAALGAVCRKYGVALHSDASQSFASQDIDVERDQIDLLTATAAKIYGPKGAALLYVSERLRPQPQALIFGGGQESGLRSATLDVPLIVGFAAAARLARAGAARENARLEKLRDQFIAQMLGTVPGVTLNGHERRRLPNNAHFSVAGVEGESLLLALDELGTAVSTGSACSSRNLQPDHSLLALGLGPAAAHGSVRFTLGRATTKEQLTQVVEQVRVIAERLRELSPLKKGG
jgi:cysteine desulfurase